MVLKRKLFQNTSDVSNVMHIELFSLVAMTVYCFSIYHCIYISRYQIDELPEAIEFVWI